MKLTLDEADIRTYLSKRFKDDGTSGGPEPRPRNDAALKVAAKIIRPAALLAGNYAFVRDVARELASLDAEAVSRAVTAVTGRR